VPEVPWPMFRLPESYSVKLGAKTPKVRVVVAVRVPDVPVMVNVTVPSVAVLLAVNVRLLFPVVGFGLHDAVTPLGRPAVTARFTLPANPFWEFT
jgi:hypothetical protein